MISIETELINYNCLQMRSPPYSCPGPVHTRADFFVTYQLLLFYSSRAARWVIQTSFHPEVVSFKTHFFGESFPPKVISSKSIPSRVRRSMEFPRNPVRLGQRTPSNTAATTLNPRAWVAAPSPIYVLKCKYIYIYKYKYIYIYIYAYIYIYK